MKIFTSFVVYFAVLLWLVICHDSARGDALRPGYSSNSADVERMVKFQAKCPKECVCSRRPCGLHIDCSDRTLSTIPRDLSPLTDCLDLSINNISKIHLDSFSTLRQLKELDLSMNNISTITTEAFAPLRMLKELWLSGNFITELPQDIFTGFKKMEELQLQDNRLRMIPANTVSKMPNLKALNLGANYISSISSNAFSKLESLEHVWLDDNRLTEIPARALGRAPTIKALALDINRIATVKNGDLDQLVALEVLLLKHNVITEIENNAFERSTSLQIIDLSYNELTSPPPAIKDALQLETLKLANNRIQSLPDLAFAGNVKMQELTLTGNPIKSAGRTSFTDLRNLRELSLEEAEDMKEFPDLSGCKQLSSLTITGGKLKAIPPNLCTDLPNLQSLTLSGNRLKNLTGLLRCVNLTQLDISDNELKELTFAETKNMPKMRFLDLASNEIRHLDTEVFSKMNHIETLNLAYNYFTSLPVKGLGSLQMLNISGVRTMLYLPPNDLLHNLRSLAAYYPYHCCQVHKIPRKVDKASALNSRWSHLHSTPPMLPPVQCSPDSGPMTPCDDLLPSTPIRVFWWIAMVVSFLLNGIILLSCALRYCMRTRRPTAIPSDEEMLGRADSDSPYADTRMAVHDSEVAASHYCLNFTRGVRAMRSGSDTFDLSLCHLALADFIVTTYTAVILTYDRATQGNFAEDGAWWQQSAFCHSAGFLLTFGTQLAFTTVAVMALERYLATMYPLQTEKHMRKNVLILTLSSAWVISLATATATLFGGAGDDTIDKIHTILPSKNGATCLPWTTDFAYIAFLVGLHIVVCLVMCVVCSLMFCARRKQSWLSARKSTRRQVTLAVAVNLIFILPLALLAVCISGYMTYSKLVDGGGEFWSIGDGRTILDMGRLLAFAMFVIPFRPLLNPILYLSFNKPLRRDIAYLGKKAIFGDVGTRRPPFPQRHNSALDTMFDSVGEVPQEAANSYPIFNGRPFESEFMRQTVAYDNRGILSSSSVHAPSISLAPSASRTGGSQRSSSEKRKRRRYTRSRQRERRTTDTDLTTESEIITFHRGGDAVYYNPESRERRRKKLSVRCGGVNAKDEFQRLVFPRVPNASSSDHGSDSTVYPIMPATRSGMTSSSCNRHLRTESPKNLSCDADASDLSSADCMSTKPQRVQIEHYDISALNTFYVQNTNPMAMVPIATGLPRETSSDPTDVEVAEINSPASPSSQEENPFFDDRDTAKRLYSESSRKKTHQRPRSNEEDFLPSTSNEGNDPEQINRRYTASPSIRKDRAASHCSGNSEVHLISRMGKIGSNSCEYCDSSASKDSGIHSEIDSTSGASYSDTSISRRLHCSTSGGGLKIFDISTIGERDIDEFDLSSYVQEFTIVPSINGAEQVKISPISNPETTI